MADNDDFEGFPADLNFEVFLRRLEAIRGPGFLEHLADSSPDLAAILEHVDFDPTELESVERILRAMTPEERLHPELFEGEDGPDRRARVAAAAGTHVTEVDGLILQFQTLRELLSNRSPQDAIQELLDEAGPRREAWQEAPDAWKSDVFELEPLLDEPEEDELPDPEVELSLAVDDLLRKISSQGLDALTPGERAFLEQASSHYRAKR